MAGCEFFLPVVGERLKLVLPLVGLKDHAILVDHCRLCCEKGVNILLSEVIKVVGIILDGSVLLLLGLLDIKLLFLHLLRLALLLLFLLLILLLLVLLLGSLCLFEPLLDQ